MVTLKDVARVAGVTKMTVSNVLNGRTGQVSEETRTRVLDAVAQLGYEPNAAARALSRAESNIVVYVYPRPSKDHPSVTFNTPHDALLMHAIELRVSAAGKHLMVHSATDAASTARRLSSWNVDGVIFFGVFGREAQALRQAHNVPMVFIDVMGPENISVVGVDDELGGYLATKHVLDAGHRNVAFVGPLVHDSGPVEERLIGYRRAMAEVAGTIEATFNSDTVLPLHPEVSRSIIEDPRSFTAAVTTADTIGAGLIQDMKAMGIRVPEDFSITGFDDVYLAEMVTPALTTIHQDVLKKGTLAADMLLSQLATGSTTQREILTPELKVRDSVAAPPAEKRGKR